MEKFVPRDKMSKKAKKKLDAAKRAAWAFSPVTRRVESKKIYSRKRVPRTEYDERPGDLFSQHQQSGIRAF